MPTIETEGKQVNLNRDMQEAIDAKRPLVLTVGNDKYLELVVTPAEKEAE